MSPLPLLPTQRLDGRHALVSGGTRGIGLGAAIALASAGADVTILGRSAETIEEATDALAREGLTVTGVALDVTDSVAVAAFLTSQPAFDILVNSAGMARHAAFLDVSAADYDAVVDLNVRALFFISQAVAARLVAEKRPGSIIHVSSQMGHVSGPRRSVYSATKFAVEGLTKAMAIELGPHNIRVNTVCPTFVETELTAKALADTEFREWVLGKIKLGRLARVEDIMGPILFLASDQAAMITGSALMVDGGWTAE
jgi:NAD(P)-dependent dehydrogenase (short-subunit alcohol dehydrogenase family)